LNYKPYFDTHTHKYYNATQKYYYYHSY